MLYVSGILTRNPHETHDTLVDGREQVQYRHDRGPAQRTHYACSPFRGGG
jgi:hypothetical protein